MGSIRYCRRHISAYDGTLVESVGLRRVYRYIIQIGGGTPARSASVYALGTYRYDVRPLDTLRSAYGKCDELSVERILYFVPLLDNHSHRSPYVDGGWQSLHRCQ